MEQKSVVASTTTGEIALQLAEAVAHPDHRNLLSGTIEGEVRVWSAPDLQFVGVIHPRAGKGAIVELQFSADAKQLLIQQTLNSSTEESGTCVIELQ